MENYTDGMTLKAQIGQDKRDPFSSSDNARIPARLSGADLGRLRVAASVDLGCAPVDRNIAQVFRARVGEEAGPEIARVTGQAVEYRRTTRELAGEPGVPGDRDVLVAAQVHIHARRQDHLLVSCAQGQQQQPSPFRRAAIDADRIGEFYVDRDPGHIFGPAGKNQGKWVACRHQWLHDRTPGESVGYSVQDYLMEHRAPAWRMDGPTQRGAAPDVERRGWGKGLRYEGTDLLATDCGRRDVASRQAALHVNYGS